jgi:hypothetical protein
LSLEAQPALRMTKSSTAYSSISAAHYSYADSGDPLAEVTRPLI